MLAERPKGEPTTATLRLETRSVTSAGPGQILLRTEYLSLDPCMRGRMSDAPSYAAPVAVGAVMEGSTVSQVVASLVDGFKPGDRVLSYNGWQDYALSDGAGVTPPIVRAPFARERHPDFAGCIPKFELLRSASSHSDAQHSEQ